MKSRRVEKYLIVEEKEIPVEATALHRETILENKSGEQVSVRTVLNGQFRNYGYTRATTKPRGKALGPETYLYSNGNANDHHEEMIRKVQAGELMSVSEADNAYYASRIGRSGTVIHLSDGPNGRAMCSQFRCQGGQWIKDATEITCKNCAKSWKRIKADGGKLIQGGR